MVGTFTHHSNNNLRDSLRKRIRAERRALTNSQLQQAAERLTPRLLDALNAIKKTQPVHRIAGYLSFQGEIDVAPAMSALRADGVKTYVPMLNGETLKFAEWSEHTPFSLNKFSIVEPEVPANQWIDAEKLDAVLVPLVAFDNNLQRMGMGGGFYDKTFSMRSNQPGPPWLLGVAHQLQRVDSVHAEWWDVPLDKIITD